MSKAKISDPSFAERLQWILREKFNGNNSQFARTVGVAITSLNRWLIGEADPSRLNLIKTAKAAGVSLEWLATGEEEIVQDISQPIENKEKTNLKTSEYDEDDDFEEIDDFRDVIVTAGFGGENDDYQDSCKTKVESAWLLARRLKAKDCAMFRVSGDSMYPTLRNGEEIVVDRSKSRLTEGNIFVLNHGGAMFVKKVQFTLNGITLISDNSDYQPLILDKEEANSLRIIGQVVRGYRDF